MSTTTIVAELVIIGLQVLLWMLLAILLVLGPDWVKPSYFKDWQTLLAALLLAISYVFGVIFDRFSDIAFSKWNRRLKSEILPNSKLPIVVMRFQVAREDEYLNQLFEYTRSRMRIARASALNIPVITVLVILSILVHSNILPFHTRIFLILLICTFGVLLTVLSVFSWRKFTITYLNLVKSNYEATLSEHNMLEKTVGRDGA